MKNFISISLVALLFLAISCTNGNKENSAYPSPWLEEITIADVQKGYAEGKFTIEEVVKGYLDRIQAIDVEGPALNSVIIVNPDALAIAQELDRELAEGKSRGPLHGIPVMLKDNIDTHDKMPNTAGAMVLRNSFPPADSWVAMKLREAGAVIIGKTNLSEWANFRSTYSSSGWSGVGGQTKNPYILDRNPCGSSAGSGVAVSANLTLLAIGTETNGSIVCPSNNNGIVGIKPTVGLISRSGIIPISFSQDTPGPMTRTVADAVICLGAMTGVDSSDSKTLASEGKALSDYTPFLKADGLKGKKIGLLKDAMGFSHRVDSLIMITVEALRKGGAEVIEIEGPSERSFGGASFTVMLYEYKDGLNKYFASLGDNAPVKTVTELIEFNKTDPVEMRYFDQDLLIKANEKGDLTSPEYLEALKQMYLGTRKEGIDRLMNSFGLDALMAPTGSPAWKTDLINGDNYIGGSSSLAAISGYPAITVPMGFIDQLPVGVSFFGREWGEPALIEVAYGFEQVTKVRKAPKFIKQD